MTTKKVLYFIAGMQPTPQEQQEISNLLLDLTLAVGIRSLLLTDTQTGLAAGSQYAETTEELETCMGVAGSYPTSSGPYMNNYTALINAGTVTDYSFQAKSNEKKLSIVAPAGASFSHTSTLQLAAVADQPGIAALDNITTACSWTSSNTAIATVGANTGLVTGVAAGIVTITAVQTVGGKSGSSSLMLTLT